MAKKKLTKNPPADHQARIETVLKAVFRGGESTPVVIDLSDEVQPNKKFPLTLTQPQRLSLLEHLDLDPSLKKKIRDAGDGKQVVIVTKKELDQLNDKIGMASVDAPAPHRKRLSAIGSQVAELFAGDHIGNLEKKVAKKSSPKPTKNIYQFKITLLGIEPRIWRRIQIPDCKLNTLHYHIQAAMGWSNSHLHHFVIERARYGIPKWLDDPHVRTKVIDSTKTKLSDILPADSERMKFKYTYDFGDYWEHEVSYEGTVEPYAKTKYPICIEGERACPPEDCGGIGGYEYLLEVLDDPNHEEHQGMKEWAGELDPEKFVLKIATVRMVRALRG